jgi:hypothetical protein
MSRGKGSAALAVLVSLVVCSTASADARNPINGYRVKANAENLEQLALAGFDVTEGRNAKTGKVEVFGSASQLAKFRRETGIRARIVRDASGRTSAQRSARIARRGQARARSAQDVPYTGSDAAYNVWTRFDAVPGDGKEQYTEQYDRLSGLSIVKQTTWGKTHLGRDVIALKVTKNAKTTADGSRPAVLFSALQHAREWLAGETCRRTLAYFTTNYGKDPQVTRLVDTRELWFLCVANPDGYEYTFTAGNRLWRKNMANNNGGPAGEIGDGVDPNRNFPRNWGLDDEGSSSALDSETYRGPSAGSEPETKAMIALLDHVDFAFQKNDHTAASLLLYPQGFQQYTPTADDAIFTALAGDDADPAIDTFDPDLGAELYITNGDTNDYAYAEKQVLSYTPEGTPASDTSLTGFEFEDKESAIQAEFKRHLAFSLDLAESAAKPEEPKSHLGNTVENFYVDTFADSYGDPQPVQATAKRSLGTLVMRYRINGGPIKETTTAEFAGGERYFRDDAVYYHRVRGTVSGTKPGDQVEVWFAQKSGNKRSDAFTYTARVESANRVLVMAAEDYSGVMPNAAPEPGPKYLKAYTDALDANGVGYDVYDVDARGRRAPDPLGVLGHYDAVIWYTGDDYVTREPGQVPGTGSSRLALDEEVAVRDFLNEGGKVFYTGKNAGRQYAEGFEFRNTGFPQPNESKQGRWCDPDLPEARDGCIAHTDDFLQYYLGAYIYVGGNPIDPDTGAPFPMAGDGDPFGPLTWDFGAGGTGAGNQDYGSTFVVTSSILDPAQFPTFASSRRLATWTRPGAAPFAPHDGSNFMAAGRTDEAYKRLHRTIDLTGATTGELKFWTSFDLEADYDYTFVEAHTVGQDDWTTLPDANGHTSTDAGLSCPTTGDGSAWQSLHPFLAHYQTVTGGGDTCSSTGTTGAWNAATGNSGGWQEWKVDLSQFAGKQVEVSITVASDPAVQGLGAWVDETQVTVGGQTTATSFETDDGGWTIGPPPPGTVKQENGWTRTSEQLDEGGVVGTDDTVYAGFGFEGISDAADRNAFMKGVLEHLGVLGG